MSSASPFMDMIKAQMIMSQRDNVLFGFVILFIVELLGGFLREFGVLMKKAVTDYVNDRIKKVESKLQTAVTSDKESEITFERHYNKEGNWDQADAILSRVLKIPDAQRVFVIGQLEIVKKGAPFDIDKGVTFQMINVLMDNDGVQTVTFKLTSKTLNVYALRVWVSEAVDDYLTSKKNNFGNKLFFFDHLFDKNPQEYQRKLLFSHHPFVTNRTLNNVFHERQQEVINRVTFFLERKDWYDKRGIPHTLGLLLKGDPGTGKTSTIKAIANVSGRHIININLASLKSKKQLKKLFYDERIDVCPNPENTNQSIEYIIPIDKRVYVMEDIDAVKDDLLLKRDYQSKQPAVTLIDPDEPVLKFSTKPREQESDIDLSSILNIMDGTLETPGRILIITSNFPEKLDDALIRPGRIDLILDFQRANKTVIRDMFVSFYNSEPDIKLLEQTEEYFWTPAEVAQSFFRNFGNPRKALEDLCCSDCSKEV